MENQFLGTLPFLSQATMQSTRSINKATAAATRMPSAHNRPVRRIPPTVVLVVVSILCATVQPLSRTLRAGTSDDDRDAPHRGPKTLVEALTEAQQDHDGSPGERIRLDPDRPHLPEASTAVGQGHVLVEGGYTFSEESPSSTHTYPEILVRAGAFTDWLELRIGQSVTTQERTVSGVTTSATGAQDLYLGVKVAVTESRRYLPELALIPQVTVPSGSRAVSAGGVLPGLNVDANWEILKNRYNIEVVVANNRIASDGQPPHLEVATGVTNVVQLNRSLEGFVEWDAFYPASAWDQTSGARHYAVGGLVYFMRKNVALDLRVGTGLNAPANRLIVGTGFAFRY